MARTTQAAVPAAPAEALIDTLEQRFEAHPQRHPGLRWANVRARLEASPKALATLAAMEASGGEPDAVDLGGAVAAEAGELVFCDCARESPAGRRSLCYDAAALQTRKANRPAGSAVEAAAALGIELLDEAQYRALQQLGAFDTTTSSWLRTPGNIRALGGALFGDRRYDTVFTYHNGAQSYYAARGFRGLLRLRA